MIYILVSTKNVQFILHRMPMNENPQSCLRFFGGHGNERAPAFWPSSLCTIFYNSTDIFVNLIFFAVLKRYSRVASKYRTRGAATKIFIWPSGQFKNWNWDETTQLRYNPTEERTIFELQGLPKNVNRIAHSACWLSYYRVGINKEQHCWLCPSPSLDTYSLQTRSLLYIGQFLNQNGAKKKKNGN